LVAVLLDHLTAVPDFVKAQRSRGSLEEVALFRKFGEVLLLTRQPRNALATSPMHFATISPDHESSAPLLFLFFSRLNLSFSQKWGRIRCGGRNKEEEEEAGENV